jgi:hypothetical protein
MASILKVDELRGIASAGDITVTSEGGAATQSLQQGLAKVWVNFNGTGTIASRDSLNVASLTDFGTGENAPNYANALSNGNYSVHLSTGDPAGIASVSDQYLYALNTTYVRTILTNWSSGSTQDMPLVTIDIHGDLA